MAASKSAPDPMVYLLADGQVEEFNKRRSAGEPCDLRGADLRHAALRGLEAAGPDLRDCYLPQAVTTPVAQRDTLQHWRAIMTVQLR